MKKPKNKPISREEAPAFVCDLLQRGSDLGKLRDELSARIVANALGQTTGFLYHHWGSFDGFLFEVSGLGWRRLVDSLIATYDESGRENERDSRAIVHAYVDFAAAHPVLYWLLAERPLSMEVVSTTLARGAALPSFQAFVSYVELMMRAEPKTMTLARARALHAAAHGVASQLLSGRLESTPDARTKSARTIAREICDAIADGFFTSASAATASKSKARRSPARDLKAASLARPRTSSPRASSSTARRRQTKKKAKAKAKKSGT